MQRVTKRNGQLEVIDPAKVRNRIANQCNGLSDILKNGSIVADRVLAGIYDKVHTTQLDTLAAETAASFLGTHPDYGKLAGRLAVSNLHKETSNSFVQTMKDLGLCTPIMEIFGQSIEAEIDYTRDYLFDFFGFKTLCRSYLYRLQEEDRILERPQHMYMRVALGIHCSTSKDIEDLVELRELAQQNGIIPYQILIDQKEVAISQRLGEAFRTYNFMSTHRFTHASPTMFNAGTSRPQMSSCFLLNMKEDSIEGIFATLDQCARISKCAGGIGVSISKIRAKNTPIKGTNGRSNGIPPMLWPFNSTARYVDQGGGKRKGAFAMYIEPWHADIFDVIDMKKNTGDDRERARDLFYALWIPDLFMQRVDEDGVWSLMCPSKCSGLSEVYGKDFNDLYTFYESKKMYNRQIPARQLFWHIIESQIETGGPYMLYKDAVNCKSNHANLGTIQGSNLCAEIVQYTSPEDVAVCNLASISLTAHVTPDKTGFDFEKLQETVAQITRNLDTIIDVNFYPVPEARKSNMETRPMGIGVQGLQDVFFLLRMPFGSPESRKINRDIFETIYYAACKTSCELAKLKGPYSKFENSPASQGQLQFDLWGVEPQLYDWPTLKKDIQKYGMRNSLLVAVMPTASTAQILGNTECIEPITSNIFSRTVLAGTFMVVNKYLVDDLIARGLWSEGMKEAIMNDNGSIRHVQTIPDDLKQLYKTVWEVKQRTIIDMSADRAPYIDQTQSLNIHMSPASPASLYNLHMYAWKKGLKTGQYYLRTRAAADPVKITTAPLKQSFGGMSYQAPDVCPIGCDSCGS